MTSSKRQLTTRSRNLSMIFLLFLSNLLLAEQFIEKKMNILGKFDIADIYGRLQGSWADYDSSNWTLKVDRIMHDYKTVSLVRLEYASRRELFLVSQHSENKDRNYRSIFVGDWFVRMGPNKPLNVIVLMTSQDLVKFRNTKTMEKILETLNTQLTKESDEESEIMVEMVDTIYMNEYGFLKKHPKQFKTRTFRQFTKMMLLNRVILKETPGLFWFKVEDSDMELRNLAFKRRFAELKNNLKDQIKEGITQILYSFYKVDESLQKENSAVITIKTRIKKSKRRVGISKDQNKQREDAKQKLLNINRKKLYKLIEEEIDNMDENYGPFEKFIERFNRVLLIYSEQRIRRVMETFVLKSFHTLFFNKLFFKKPNVVVKQLNFVKKTELVSKYVEGFLGSVFNRAKVTKELENLQNKFMKDTEQIYKNVNKIINDNVSFDFHLKEKFKFFKEDLKALTHVSSFCTADLDPRIMEKLTEDMQAYLFKFLETGDGFYPELLNEHDEVNVFLMKQMYIYFNGPMEINVKVKIQEFNIIDWENNRVVI